jgi:hypothetical protein
LKVLCICQPSPTVQAAEKVEKADSSWAIGGDESQCSQETVEGHGFGRAESVPPGKGFSPGQPRLKAFLMEFDFVG